MQRRVFMSALTALSSTLTPAQSWAASISEASSQDLALAWRSCRALSDSQPGAGSADHVGLVRLDWQAKQISLLRALRVPGRAHGLVADRRGGFYAVATRPGTWLIHVDADANRPPRLLNPVSDESSSRTLNGHLLLSADGRWIYSTETDARSGLGWIVRRDAQSLRCEEAWPSHGMDPHHLLLDETDASLLVANGGIPRDAAGRKHSLDVMDPSLVRLSTQDGRLLGRWQLPDKRLSLRHMAWSQGGERRLLGIGLQAEHDSTEARRSAPLLAVFDGQQLSLPSWAADGAGYAGDIAAGPGGSFLISAQKAGRGLLWHPDAPTDLLRLADLREVCALVSWCSQTGETGLLMAAASGIARWQASGARMLAWPGAMAPDNHAALIL